MLLQVKVALHRIGNSQGVILRKTLLAQVGFTENELEMTIEGDAIVLRKPRKSVRVGWADAAKQLAQSGDDALVCLCSRTPTCLDKPRGSQIELYDS